MSRPDPKDLWIHNQKSATIVRLPGSVNGFDLTIEDLDDCTVYILDWSAQITVDYCTNTRFVIGPVDGPFFIRNCTNCTVTVACRQLRTRECVDSDFFLYCATKSPVIESSSKLRFHQFDVSYPGLSSHFTSAKLNPAINHNDLIYDFTEHDASIPKPHWTIVQQVPPIRQLRCMLDGKQIDGDIADTPLTTVHPSTTEEMVEKTSAAAAAAAPAAAAASSTPATAAPKMESFGSKSFGSQSIGSQSIGSQSIGSQSIGSQSIGSQSFGSKSFGSASTGAATASPAAATTATTPVFEEGVAPSIPQQQQPAVVAEPAAPAVASESVAAVDATSTSAAEPATAEAPAASADAAAADSPDTDKVVVKEASFSFDTSAEDATKALFALAGVEYKPAAPKVDAKDTAAAADAAAAVAPAASSSASLPIVESPQDEDARLAAWFSQTPGMATGAHAEELSADQAATTEARVAEAERKRIEGIEARRKRAEEAASAAKAAASSSVQAFYQQRDSDIAARRKATASSSTLMGSTTTQTPSAHPTHPDLSNGAASASAPSLSDAMMLALQASSAASSSASAAAAASPALSVDAGWAQVLSMVPPNSLSKHSASEIMRMKMMYAQLKGVSDKQRAADEEAERRARKEEKKRKKKEKKKKKRAKRREQRKATAAALTAAVIAAGGVPPPPLPEESDSDSSSDSSSDEE